MTIYRIRPDVNRYQSFVTTNPNDYRFFLFDCQPVGKSWKAPEVYIDNPKLKRGNFFGVAAGAALAVDEATLNDDHLAEMLEMCGELLPFRHEGETFYVINVLNCINALDRERSVWYQNKPIGAPDRFAFNCLASQRRRCLSSPNCLAASPSSATRGCATRTMSSSGITRSWV